MYTLYSFNTPNGHKPTIMLEELKVPYDIITVDITKNEQFKPEFLAISPNNKIPVLYDEENQLHLFESVAILNYLAEKHQQFLPQDLKEKYKVLQWCYFQAAHIGPMLGQFGHFHRYAKEDVPYAKKRYADECNRLFSVLEKQLVLHEFIAGEAYTIADMAIWPWIYCFQHFYKAEIGRFQFPSLLKWYDQLAQRPAVSKALNTYSRTI